MASSDFVNEGQIAALITALASAVVDLQDALANTANQVIYVDGTIANIPPGTPANTLAVIREP